MPPPRRTHCFTQAGVAFASVRHDRIIPVAETVTPNTALPSVMYTASTAVGAPVASTGTPRELKMTQAVPAMSTAGTALSLHLGAWPMAPWVLAGAVPTTP